MNLSRDQRDRLETLQAELRSLEVARLETQRRLREARELAREARRRELVAARAPRGPALDVKALERAGVDLVKVSLIIVAVVAVFATVLGTVTYAIHRYDRSATRYFSE